MRPDSSKKRERPGPQRRLLEHRGCGESAGPPEDGAVLLPIPVALPPTSVQAGPEGRESVELDEIVAVRQSDRRAMVLGYGSIAEEALYLLIDGFSGGGFGALMTWANAEPKTGLFYDPELGLLIGPEGRPRLVVRRSGCRVRFTFVSARDDTDADIADFSWWGPSEG